MGNDSAPGGFAGFIEKIKKWGAPFIGVALFVFGLQKGVKEVEENITWTVLAAVSVVWLFLFWVYTSKTEREVREAIDQHSKFEKVPQFPKWRRWALTGMILLPALTISGFAVAEYIERRPSTKIIVLVADFQGPDPRYAVTPTVINKLRRATEEYPEVEIKALRMTITEQEGSTAAREKGKEKKASIVIWGFYDDSQTGTVHIETLSEQHRLPRSYAIRRNGEQIDYSASVADKPGLTVRESIAGDMSLITLLLLGVIYFESENYDEAVRRFSRALEQKISSQVANYQSDLLFFRGTSFALREDFDSAIADFDQAIKLKPDALAYFNRGNAYYDKGQHDRAIADYDQAIRLKPKFAPAYDNRGAAYNNKGDYDRAIADYDQAIKLKPDDAYAYNSRGLAYSKKGLLDRAIADYDQAIRLKPDVALAYFNRGNAHKNAGNKQSAIADFRKSLELPTNPNDRKEALEKLRSLGVKAE